MPTIQELRLAEITCPLTNRIFKNPVTIFPAELTIDEEAKEHYQGQVDEVIPNSVMKRKVERYLQEFPPPYDEYQNHPAADKIEEKDLPLYEPPAVAAQPAIPEEQERPEQKFDFGFFQPAKVVKLPRVAALKLGFSPKAPYFQTATLLLGATTAGKTHFCLAAAEAQIEKFVETIGNFKIRKVNGEKYQIFDTAGKEKSETITSAYFHHSALLLFFIEDLLVNRQDSGIGIEKWIALAQANVKGRLHFVFIDYPVEGNYMPVLREFDANELRQQLSDQIGPIQIADPLHAQQISDNLLTQLTARLRLAADLPAQVREENQRKTCSLQ